MYEMNKRVDRLVDTTAFMEDPYYHAQVSYMKGLLALVHTALDDEDVDPRVTHRVLERITLGTPTGADAQMRMAEGKRQVEKLKKDLPPPRAFHSPGPLPHRQGVAAPEWVKR